jgi:hypothetical protein
MQFFHQTPGLEVRIPPGFHQPGRMSTIKILTLILILIQLKTGGNLIDSVRNWAGGKLPSVFLNSST